MTEIDYGNTGLVKLADDRERLVFIVLRQIFRRISPSYNDAHKAAGWSILLWRIWRYQGNNQELYTKYKTYSHAYNVTRWDG